MPAANEAHALSAFQSREKILRSWLCRSAAICGAMGNKLISNLKISASIRNSQQVFRKRAQPLERSPHINRLNHVAPGGGAALPILRRLRTNAADGIADWARRPSLKICAGLAVACLVVVGLPTNQSSAQGRNVGELSNLIAWVDKLPPRLPSTHATGMITAPTPCYDALAEFDGVDNSNPPIYRVKVTLREQPGYCIQTFADIPFSYRRWNYADRTEEMTITSEYESKTISIEVAR